MHWPIQDEPVPSNAIPTFNALYLHGCGVPSDPGIVWGSDVVTDELERYLNDLNRSDAPCIVSVPHVLIQATAHALQRHPEFNRRILRERIYEFKDVNVLMGMQHPVERCADTFLLCKADQLPLTEIAAEVWNIHRQAARGQFKYDGVSRLQKALPRLLRPLLIRFNLWMMNRVNLPSTSSNERQRSSPVLINYLGFAGAPPMVSYHPSRLPVDAYTLNVTLGKSVPTAVVEDGEVVVRNVAKLFVRGDHRLVDAVELGYFTSTLRNLLTHPQQMEVTEEDSVEPLRVMHEPEDSLKAG